MKEKDYMLVSDLRAVMSARDVLRLGNFLEMPNQSRYNSIMANLELMSEDLFKRIEVESDD